MKYAHEVMDLMACYPGRSFRLMELVRHVSHGRDLSIAEKTRLQRGIQRAMDALKDTGSVLIQEPQQGGHGRTYAWRVTVASQEPLP
ncbi:hypothetical protein LMG26685_01775 [Achromobacter mucicolens]|uniref:hypothetical protein n=1 Tax=Achromobacter mucicolens TaxID=1389922 RepID=UPI0009C5F8AB|nr:hypothetical protein [Achromobacter mucicolens]OXC90444.1 hypothetical protein BMR85_015470 [Achromobacter sp. KAs 3-5]CAB3638335.1 hypothetical protein LMG26685_01775 [Achromobacter mucicolens]